MRIVPVCAALVAILAFGFTPTAWCGDTTQAGVAILQQGVSVLRTAGTQPLKQSGKFIALTGPKPVLGTYTYANNGSVMRDEIAAAGYGEIRIRSGSVEKIQRPLAFSPLAVYAAFDAVRPGKWMHLASGERIKRVTSQKVSNLPSKCVEIESGHARSVCFYDDGTLAAVHIGTGWVYEYSAYSTFQNARLPGRIRVSENRSPVAELQLDSGQVPGTADVRDEIGNPTTILGWCEGLTPPALIRRVTPRYPEVARQTLTQGAVDLYGIIAADGRVQGLGVVRSAGAILDKSGTEAVSLWMYSPAMCGTEPVAAEAIISVHYTLSR